MCSYYTKDYDQCIDLCDQLLNYDPTDKAILKLKSDAVTTRVRNAIDCECVYVYYVHKVEMQNNLANF